MSECFGLWGGTTPGGWCMFLTSRSQWCEYVGTLEEAEAGKRQFLREREERERKYGRGGEPDTTTYEVVLFDPEREPVGLDGVPSKAQAAFLQCLIAGDDYRSVLQALPQWRATNRALHDKGWIFHEVISQKMKVTRAGLRALAKVLRSTQELQKNVIEQWDQAGRPEEG